MRDYDRYCFGRNLSATDSASAYMAQQKYESLRNDIMMRLHTLRNPTTGRSLTWSDYQEDLRKKVREEDMQSSMLASTKASYISNSGRQITGDRSTIERLMYEEQRARMLRDAQMWHDPYMDRPFIVQHMKQPLVEEQSNDELLLLID